MKKILLLLVAVCAFGLTGCAAGLSTSIKTVEVGPEPETVRPLPLTADLNVSEQKVRGEAQGRLGADMNAENRLVREAVARALGQDPPKVEAPDVLMAMNVYKEPKGKDSLRVVVTGYPAWYHNFRTVEESGDSAWLILTNTSGQGGGGSGGGDKSDQKKSWWEYKNEGKGKEYYLGVNRMLKGSLGGNEWAAVEGGWLKRSGLFYGFEFGIGSSGDNYSAGVGFNIGGTYNLPSNIGQLAYGASVGAWIDRYNYYYGDDYNLGVAGPFVKLRWKVVEVAYRGVIGANFIDSDRINAESSFVWFNQYRAGLHFEF